MGSHSDLYSASVTAVMSSISCYTGACHNGTQLYFVENLPCYDGTVLYGFNTLRPRQHGRHFPDDIFKYIFLNDNASIFIKISLEFVPKGQF